MNPRHGENLLLLLALTIWMTILSAFAGCGAGPAQQHATLNVITDVADPTYQAVVEGCDTFRDAIRERQGTTYEEDEAAMLEVDHICDPMVAGFETLRGTQLTARAAIDAGAEAAVLEGIRAALTLWTQLQQLVPSLQELGRTPPPE